MTLKQIIEKSFEQLKTLPCWGVKQGHGSFLTLEFGQPHLDIIESKTRKRRRITVHGDWHLWIYCCYWVIKDDGQTLAHCESEREEINQALQKIDGQMLRKITLGPEFACAEFEFEWGVKLQTEPYEHTDKSGIRTKAGCYSSRMTTS